MSGDGIGKSKRQEIKELIRELKKVNPEVDSHIFKSVEKVNLETIIGYKKGGRAQWRATFMTLVKIWWR